MRGFKSIFVSSKHKINCFLIQEKYFQTANAVDTLPLSPVYIPFTGQIYWKLCYVNAALVCSIVFSLYLDVYINLFRA